MNTSAFQPSKGVKMPLPANMFVLADFERHGRSSVASATSDSFYVLEVASDLDFKNQKGVR